MAYYVVFSVVLSSLKASCSFCYFFSCGGVLSCIMAYSFVSFNVLLFSFEIYVWFFLFCLFSCVVVAFDISNIVHSIVFYGNV